MRELREYRREYIERSIVVIGHETVVIEHVLGLRITKNKGCERTVEVFGRYTVSDWEGRTCGNDHRS